MKESSSTVKQGLALKCVNRLFITTVMYVDYDDGGDDLTGYLLQDHFAPLNFRGCDKCPINSGSVQHYKGLNIKPEAICSLEELILGNPK